MDSQDEDGDDLLVDAGLATYRLLAASRDWMNRRVETVEILTYEETRHRVSLDFSLTSEQREELRIGPNSCAVPLGALSKGPRSHFDLCDEAGTSVPVLGRDENSALAHVALFGAALQSLEIDIPDHVAGEISEALYEVVDSNPTKALEAANRQFELAEGGDPWRSAIFDNGEFLRLIEVLVENYIVFAVLPVAGPDWRILKYSFGFDAFEREDLPSASERWQRLKTNPDQFLFVIPCYGSGWAKSFHLEVAIPEELRARNAYFVDADTGIVIGDVWEDINRVSLHLPSSESELRSVDAVVELIPERGGAISQALSFALLMATTLVIGSAVGPRSLGDESIVSILLVAAALFGGLAATRGQHRLVSKVFSSTQFWTNIVAVGAVGGALCLAMWSQGSRPIWAWYLATVLASVALVRLAWSWRKAAS